MPHFGDSRKSNTICSARSIYGGRSYWIPGSYAPGIVREARLLFKAIEKEGLQGGKGDNHWLYDIGKSHDPGIQQEPRSIGRYTQATWGREQRNIYLTRLDACFHLLAQEPERGRACDAIRPGYRKYTWDDT
jgi:hypothetical protein